MYFGKSIMWDVMLRTKPIQLLIAIKDAKETNNKTAYSLKLARKANCTWAHTHKVLKKLEKADLVIIHERWGRTRPVTLTNKGEQVANHLIQITKMLKNKRGKNET